jgi:hypothetical protein
MTSSADRRNFPDHEGQNLRLRRKFSQVLIRDLKLNPVVVDRENTNGINGLRQKTVVNQGPTKPDFSGHTPMMSGCISQGKRDLLAESYAESYAFSTTSAKHAFQNQFVHFPRLLLLSS